MTLPQSPQNEIDTPEVMPSVLVTPRAAQTIRELQEERNIVNHVLRIGIAGGGCSGFQYYLGFDEAPHDGDTLIEAHGIQVVIDPQSEMYMRGTTIDFVEDATGGGFRIANPNAMSSCDCSSQQSSGCSGCSG